ncbi:hypothetical protein ODZ83_10910 [Acaricomes phytoseiuli]|uniref:hypothetical protein n=1 Tax=Acaricomes phytoseiuli TaxID=291968 RepID=UPI002223964B|nr:hypothetical protein [Acaricomes phytoseiuli]MCW1250671.1 hypothetical protein [Acaricomes phytoseiuli]
MPTLDEFLIALCGAVLVALTAGLRRAAAGLKRIGEDAKAARHQVENDHTENFRDAQDRQHGELTISLNRVLSEMHAQSAGLAELREDVQDLREDVQQQRLEVHDIRRAGRAHDRPENINQ